MVTRLSGFSNSGIDIDDTVKKLMAAARMPQDKLKQKKQTLEWQRDNYRAMNAKIMDFRNAAFNMRLQASYQTKKSVSADESVVSVSATSVAPEGNYALKVNKLATSASVTSGTVGAKSDTVKLKDIPGAGFAAATTLSIGGEKGTATINVNPTDTIASLVSAVNSKSSTTGVTMSYDANIDKFFFVSSTTGSNAKVDLKTGGGAPNIISTVLKLPGTSSLSSSEKVTGSRAYVDVNADADYDTLIDGSLLADENLQIDYKGVSKNFTIDKDTKIGDLIGSINAAIPGVTASLDGSGKLVIANTDRTKPITFSGNIKTTIGLATPTVTPDAMSSKVITSGQAFATGITTLIDKNLTTVQKLHLDYGGVTADLDVSNTTTVGKLIDQINSSAIGKAGVSAYLDGNKKIAFTNPDQNRNLTFGEDTTDTYKLLSKLGLDSADANPALQPIQTVSGAYSSYTVLGTKAEIEFNGAAASYDTNTFSINGMTFTAKKEGGGPVNITNTNDVDSIFNSIKSFVDKYNQLISDVATQLSEKKYRDFTPLTDEQREVMKDDQIKSWEDKAKSGMLRGDSILTRGLTSFRGAFSKAIEGLPTGDVKKLGDIGISSTLTVGSTISGSYLENGKIYLDDTKLKKAIAEKPDEVMALFITNDGLKDSDNGDGLATRLYDKADALIKTITAKAGASTSVDSSFVLGKSVKEINTKIDNFTLKLDALETRYYSQFTAMEKYMNQMTAQSAQLTQQMG